ncbi:hypothetical protein FMZ60_09020 [Alcaligenaceae bacterium SJ-26]|nr:hypothetical protein FMZ60_09020 [Alcaligenaceae bacterium SJ-26]
MNPFQVLEPMVLAYLAFFAWLYRSAATNRTEYVFLRHYVRWPGALFSSLVLAVPLAMNGLGLIHPKLWLHIDLASNLFVVLWLITVLLLPFLDRRCRQTQKAQKA